MMPELRIYA